MPSSPADRSFDARPHRRLNLLTGEWILVSPHRTARPWQGQVESTPSDTRPAHDPSCYLCPGNVRANGERNPQYDTTFVFTNDFAALVPDPVPHPPDEAVTDGMLRAELESGTCRVVAFSPRHDRSLSQLSQRDVRAVVDAWTNEFRTLGARDDIGYVQIFENRGEMMGASNPHPHGQIWAERSVPDIPRREGERQREWFASHGSTLLADYLATELQRDERIVCDNTHFVALVPYWATWPFETMIVGRTPRATLLDFTDDERDAFADIIRAVTARYDRLFGVPFPYSAGIHQAPTDGEPHAEWHLHMHFYPPLLRSATVKKFLVGYEMLAGPQRDITPEAAAERLRAIDTSDATLPNA